MTLPSRPNGAIIDAGLLILTLMVSGQLLIQTGIQSGVWLLCYALALLRIAMNWTALQAVFLRNGWVFGYGVGSLASALWAVDPLGSLTAAVQLNVTLLIAFYLGWRYSVVTLVRAIAVLFAFGIAFSLLHWATHVFPWPVHTDAGGLAGLFSHKNMLGGRALFLSVFLVAFLLMGEGRTALNRRPLLMALLAVALLALALSKAMTSLILLSVVMSAFCLLSLSRMPLVLSVTVSGCILVAVAVGPLVLTALAIAPVHAVLDLSGKDVPLTGRTVLWSVALNVIGDNPLLGVGYGAFWTAPGFANQVLLTQEAGAVTSTSFHNFALEIMVASGPLGLVAMLGLIGVAITRLWRLYTCPCNRDRSILAGACLALILGAVGDAMMGASLYRQHEFYLVFLAALAVSAQEDWRQDMKTTPMLWRASYAV